MITHGNLYCNLKDTTIIKRLKFLFNTQIENVEM